MTDRDDALIGPGNEISDDTHVGATFDRLPAGATDGAGVAGAAAEQRPDALIEGNRVATPEDMEGSDIDDPLRDPIDGLPQGTHSDDPAALP